MFICCREVGRGFFVEKCRHTGRVVRLLDLVVKRWYCGFVVGLKPRVLRKTKGVVFGCVVITVCFITGKTSEGVGSTPIGLNGIIAWLAKLKESRPGVAEYTSIAFDGTMARLAKSKELRMDEPGMNDEYWRWSAWYSLIIFKNSISDGMKVSSSKATSFSPRALANKDGRTVSHVKRILFEQIWQSNFILPSQRHRRRNLYAGFYNILDTNNFRYQCQNPICV